MSHNPTAQMADSLPVVLLTRPKEASDRVLASLQTRGLAFRPVVSPLIGISHVDHLPDMTGFRGLIFTSANGVRSYVALGGAQDLPAYCVGDSTCAAALAAGLGAISAQGNADDLVALLGETRPETPLIHLRGTHSRGDVAARLNDRGVFAKEAIIYNQPILSLTNEATRALAGPVPVVAPLYSPRTAKILGTYPIKAPFLVAAMSQAVANAVASLHKQNLEVAARPESDVMLDVIETQIKRASIR